VAEANENNSITCATNTSAMHQVKFRKLPLQQMMFNNESGGVRSSPMRDKKRSSSSLEEKHELVVKPMGTASYDRTKKTWRVLMQKYLKQKCATCKMEKGD
jgi:hypothetical protein